MVLVINYCLGKTNTFPVSGDVGIGTPNPVDIFDFESYIRPNGIRTNAMPIRGMIYIGGTGY